jgi:hypothetical protein
VRESLGSFFGFVAELGFWRRDFIEYVPFGKFFSRDTDLASHAFPAPVACVLQQCQANRSTKSSAHHGFHWYPIDFVADAGNLPFGFSNRCFGARAENPVVYELLK